MNNRTAMPFVENLREARLISTLDSEWVSGAGTDAFEEWLSETVVVSVSICVYRVSRLSIREGIQPASFLEAKTSYLFGYSGDY